MDNMRKFVVITKTRGFLYASVLEADSEEEAVEKVAERPFVGEVIAVARVTTNGRAGQLLKQVTVWPSPRVKIGHGVKEGS